MNNPSENVFVIPGGQGAGKTISILMLIKQSLLSSEKEATVLSGELAKMKRTVIRDYKKISRDWGTFKDESDFNKSESKHEYPNGSYIDFLGADSGGVGKGFRRDILYINEADKMVIDTATQFISRAKLTIIDHNPDKLFWGDDYVNERNTITLTHEDNEYISDSERQSILEYKVKGFYNPDLEFHELFKDENIKSKYWSNKHKVYGLGMVGALEGVVFENWEVVDEIPLYAKRMGYGLDYGYSNDPTALTDILYADGFYYLDELIYKTKLLNKAISKEMEFLGVDRFETITADSAELKSNEDLRVEGWIILDAKKGPDSIVYGVSKMQELKFKVTKRSLNLINELQKYTWMTDKSGNSLNKPIDNYNHAIDGIRYHFQTIMGDPDAPRFFLG